MKCLRPSFFHLLFFSVLFVMGGCKNNSTLFRLMPSSESGIHFNNEIVENDSINPIDVTNIYNGGGVGVGDFNNDGLQDLYFTGNLVSNKLYLNKGNIEFADITAEAGVDGAGRWSRGVSVVDINNDGWLDLYVCASMLKDGAKRQNLLYINQGIDGKKTPTFKEMAASYGLNDTAHATMAAFFDYDNDGDLDVYIVVNEIRNQDNPAVFRPKITDGSHFSTGRLYRNDWDAKQKHGVFKNISKEAGTIIEGYGHAVTIADFNQDGWKDIFVTNDFNSNDLLYINNKNGTFTDKAASYFKHTSANGMGQDVIDINNDGLADVIELDMNPEDNYRKKMMMGANSYQAYQNSDYYKYQYQYVRNTLQLNQGPRVTAGDSVGEPVFSEVGFSAGIAETDWSWTPVVQDFDNNGFRDVIVTNGFPKDVTDHDFIAFRSQSFSVASKEYTLQQIPQVKLHNYAYRNTGRFPFEDATRAWGFEKVSFSNGAAYADLDNDGDLDVIINNINDEAFVYENTLSDDKARQHYLSLQLAGDARNRNALGARIELYYGGGQQVYEQTPYRGYLSSVQLAPHFGLDTFSKIDSLVIKWPGSRKTVLHNVAANQQLKLDIRDATQTYSWTQPAVAANTLFTDVTKALQLQYKDSAKDFIDFNIQKLLPHKFTEYGPAMAVGDMDGNGLEDVVIGGAPGYSAAMQLQQADGRFVRKNILQDAARQTKLGQDMGIVVFDSDGDGDLDIYVAGGGYKEQSNTEAYRDQLYQNDGNGNFSIDTAALPESNTSKSCVRAADYDRDGDLDLFVGGRVVPWQYPKPASSAIYRNDSKNGVPKFTDVTPTVASGLENIGLVCDAVFTDFNGDGWQDLILAGEWMPVTFLRNEHGVLKKFDAGISKSVGWWTSIVPGDFDNDGDMDYIAGNLGLNSFYRASAQRPVSIYAKDFDGNGAYDAVPTLFLPTSQQDSQRIEYPAHLRDDMAKQLISFRSKFQNYKSYATAPFAKMFTEEELKGALKLEANYFSNSYIKNNGDGTFALEPLPATAQFACLNGMLAEDFDGDGNLDVLAVGNDYGTEVSVGRYDACNGAFLKGDGNGNFFQTSILQSGWFVPGNAKALVKLKGANGKCLIAASQNKDDLKMFEWKHPTTVLALNPADASAVLTFKNGKKQKRELQYGASFLSQSGRFLNVANTVKSVEIQDSKGGRRTVALQ